MDSFIGEGEIYYIKNCKGHSLTGYVSPRSVFEVWGGVNFYSRGDFSWDGCCILPKIVINLPRSPAKLYCSGKLYRFNG